MSQRVDRAPVVSTVGLADTHCHLTDRAFADDLDDVIARARTAGVGHIVAVGGGGPIEASEAAAELARRHDFIRATAGIHPHDASTYDDAIESRIRALLDAGRVVAVGETGLDYHYENSPRDAQRDALARQLALAARYDVPVVLHCRDAESDLRTVIQAERKLPIAGVVHCFTGTYEDARWYLDAGLAVSFTGIVTFKNAYALRDVASRLPLDRVMVETDSPYLAPTPHRGKRNEPSFVTFVAEALGALHGTDLAAVARQTGATAEALFFPAQPSRTPTKSIGNKGNNIF